MAFYEHEGKKIHYEIYGEGKGEPIVLLNGIMMSTTSWHMFIPALSANNKLILMDFFDQGQSEKLIQQTYDQSIQIAALKGLLDYLELDKVNLVGISYGGNVALRFAAEFPNEVKRLVVFHSAAKTSPWLAAVGKSWNLSINCPENYYNTAIPVIYSQEFFNNNPEWIAVREKFLTTQVFTDKDFLEAIVRLTNSNESHDITGILGNVTAKALIVAAEHDVLTPVSDQEEIVSLIKDAELILMPNAGHASMYEKPTLFPTLVLGFINTDFGGL